MKKIFVEILMVIAFSALVAIIYNASTGSPLPLVKKPLDERYIKESSLFDENYVATVESLENTLSYQQVMKIVRHPDILLIDARRPEDYEKNKIGNAINIFPDEENPDYYEQLIMLPREKKLIVYCDGGTCDLSHHVANDLLNMGFEKVFLYYGGWEEWAKEKGLEQ